MSATVSAACARKPQTNEMLNLFTTQSSRSRSDNSTWLSFCVVTFAQNPKYQIKMGKPFHEMSYAKYAHMFDFTKQKANQ